VPLTIFLIFIILYTMFRSFKWALLILLNVAMARVGGLLALLVTGTFFSVSSGVGFLALFGVSVQTGVIMLEYINQLRGAWLYRCRRRCRRGSLAVAADHDDDAGGYAGASSGGHVSRHWIRLAAPVRNRHCRGIDFRSAIEHLPAPDPLCLVRARGRYVAETGSGGVLCTLIA
jgi:hypothetical protein